MGGHRALTIYGEVLKKSYPVKGCEKVNVSLFPEQLENKMKDNMRNHEK